MPDNKEGLTKEQKMFIEAKVRRLGSVDKVRFDYRRKDEVSEYALEFAAKIFGKYKRGG
jgi:hypothetical protein